MPSSFFNERKEKRRELDSQRADEKRGSWLKREKRKERERKQYTHTKRPL
jgi:hypothetical protein